MELAIANRITQAFEQKNEKILSVYFSAGFPQLNDTVTIIKSLEAGGADIIEIGIPFSDPVADGPTIQESNQVALKNGMSLKLLFEQLKNIRNEVSIPLIMMGYINPVIQFGIESFCNKCKEVGIDGIILPDLPLQEYINDYKATFEKYGLHNICLITPQTSEERIRLIDRNTSGFTYMVSSASITGAKKDISTGQLDYFQRVKNMDLENPVLIGFGISNNETFETACRYSNGAIIGSAFINLIKSSKNLKEDIKSFISSIRG